MPPTIRIVLVDDHSIVRDGVRVYLSTQADLVIVGEASSGDEAMEVVQETLPDVVVMDLRMPGMGGVDATRQIRQRSPQTQVVILTSFHDDADLFPALEAGAIAYLLKSVRPQEVAAAIRAAARNEAVIPPQLLGRVVRRLHEPYAKKAENPFAVLTDREQDILRLIAQGLSNAEMAAQLILSEKTVKGYVSNILQKLHLTDRTKAAVLAWQAGFMEPPH